jgi:hypothetical protein
MRIGVVLLVAWLLLVIAFPLWALLSEELPECEWRVRRPRQLRPLFLDAQLFRLDLQQRRRRGSSPP